MVTYNDETSFSVGSVLQNMQDSKILRRRLSKFGITPDFVRTLIPEEERSIWSADMVRLTKPNRLRLKDQQFVKVKVTAKDSKTALAQYIRHLTNREEKELNFADLKKILIAFVNQQVSKEKDFIRTGKLKALQRMAAAADIGDLVEFFDEKIANRAREKAYAKPDHVPLAASLRDESKAVDIPKTAQITAFLSGETDVPMEATA